MVRVIVKYNGISRIIYEGYDIEVGLYIKKTVTMLGFEYMESTVNQGNMVYRYIDVYMV